MSLLAPLFRRLHAPVYASRLTRLTAAIAPHLAPGGRLPELTLAHPRICLMDGAANTGYGVACLYDDPAAAGWRERFAAAGLRLAPEDETTALQLCPRPHRWVFTPGLQDLAVAKVPEVAGGVGSLS